MDYCFGNCRWVNAHNIRTWLKLTRISYWRRRYLCHGCIAEIETLAGIDDIAKLDLRTVEARLLVLEIQLKYFGDDRRPHNIHSEDELGW